jgi:hypothetical protein
MGRVVTSADRLGADHVCRRDDPGYASVGEWYEAHRGRVPIQAAQALSRLVRERHMSFADAFRTLVQAGALILIEDEAEEGPAHTVTVDQAGDGELDGDLDEEA